LKPGSLKIIKASEILSEISEAEFTSLPLYNHPQYLNLIAPGKVFYAKISNQKGQDAYFPFSGQNLILKWRIFQIPFCQKFEPFGIENRPDIEHWALWFQFMETKCLKSLWPSGYIPENFQAKNQKVQIKTNQYFDLSPNFETILASWKSNRRSALNKSKDLIFNRVDQNEFEKGLLSSLEQPPANRWKPSKKELASLFRLSSSTFFSNHIERYQILKSSSVLTSVLLLTWHDRVHYLFSYSSEDGLKREAPTRFFSEIIKGKAKQKILFDFEGSSIEGIQNFFNSLGAISENYYLLKT